MSRTFRYVFKEVLSPTLLGLVIYTFVLLMNLVFSVAELAIRKNLPVTSVFKPWGRRSRSLTVSGGLPYPTSQPIHPARAANTKAVLIFMAWLPSAFPFGARSSIGLKCI